MVCLSIPKVCEKTSERVLSNAKTIKRISDEYFDIFVIPQSDFEMLKSIDSWKEDTKSILQTLCYSTKDENEVYSTPYLNLRTY